jgi:hypothetical protein
MVRIPCQGFLTLARALGPCEANAHAVLSHFDEETSMVWHWTVIGSAAHSTDHGTSLAGTTAVGVVTR